MRLVKGRTALELWFLPHIRLSRGHQPGTYHSSMPESFPANPEGIKIRPLVSDKRLIEEHGGKGRRGASLGTHSQLGL